MPSPLTKIRQLGWKTAVRRVWQKADHGIRRKLGLPVRIRSRDRLLLDEQFLPWFAARTDIKRVLFVGCDYYTAHYPGLFPNAEFWTIEPRATKAKYGGNHHVVAYLQDLRSHAQPHTFDLIVCNGVYGWGLDAADDIQSAFAACFDCLRPGGYFILGWNDVPERTPVPLSSIPALQNFEPWVFPGTAGSRVPTGSDTGHVFDFYRKRKNPSA